MSIRRARDVNSLFQQGVQELRYDFEEDVFLQEYLAGAKPAAVAKFRRRGGLAGAQGQEPHRRA